MTDGRFNFAEDIHLSDLFPRDSHVVEPAEIRRLSAQTARVIARLRQGPATARELVAIALNYRARISDARAAGYVIQCDDDPTTGASLYTLTGEPQ